MQMDHMTPEQVDALGRMNKKIHDEFRNLGYSGLTLDPVRFLAFRTQTHNDRFTELVVSDAGVFFLDPVRKVKYRFHPDYFFVYHEGLHATEEQKLKGMEGPVLVLENLLEFWKRQGTGFCLVADHLNKLDFLGPAQRAELDRVQRIYSSQDLVINPMLQRKVRESPAAPPQPQPLPQPRSQTRVISLDD
ncbi:MAG TPA: hypothetical protein VHE12_04920 [bacterium]|nr:hypothetical protein [bacterium]